LIQRTIEIVSYMLTHYKLSLQRFVIFKSLIIISIL